MLNNIVELTGRKRIGWVDRIVYIITMWRTATHTKEGE